MINRVKYFKGNVTIPLEAWQIPIFEKEGWQKVEDIQETSEEKELLPFEPDATEIEETKPICFEDMSKEELVAYARECGLKVSERASKAKIIEAIQKSK